MTVKVLGIGEVIVTNDKGSIIKTFSLGSCIAIMMYHKKSSTGGMAHIALSNSKINIEKSEKLPGYFADTAIPELLSGMRKIIGYFNNEDIIVKIAGGASVMDGNNFFNIGKTNISTIKRILSDLGLKIANEDVGDYITRTVSFDISNDEIIISNAEKGKWNI